MKKKILTLIPMGVMALSLLVGGATYALFTRSATNANNTFTAGEINLSQIRDQGDTVPGPMFYSSSTPFNGKFPYDIARDRTPGGESVGGLAPGDSMTRAMIITNAEDSLDAKVTKMKAKVNVAGESSGAAYEEFISKMKIKVTAPLTDDTLYDGTLSGLLTDDDDDWVNVLTPMDIYANGSLALSFKVTLDPSTNNNIQDKNFVFDFSFYAEQLRNNP